MRFLRKNKVKKTILVISDIHLGAGIIVDNQRNFLEDFHCDKELVDFIEYYSKGDYLSREVELIINGDLFDLLAVPFVKYFDDEFWSEGAALEKLKIIIEAHQEIINALIDFVQHKKNSLTYIIGNHDAELILPLLQDYLIGLFPEKSREKFKILQPTSKEYTPSEGIVIKHGHEYEIAHHFHPDTSIAKDTDGKKYFIPPWGSYYITRVVNKFKEERSYINSVRPIRKFIINSLIYDTLFILRFILSTFFYFVMVRCIFFYKQNKNIKSIIKHIINELQLFKDYETLTEDFFQDRPEVKVLLVGHTHQPIFRAYNNGPIFINTGTWTKMHHLDFDKQSAGEILTFAQIDIPEGNSKTKEKSLNFLDVNLRQWKGVSTLPFCEIN
jgi:UDP-2,3-diacylglucosamine pyrophosphatase LpxH